MFLNDQMGLWIVFVISLLLHHRVTEGSCAFPMNSGTWLSTDKGSLVVRSSEITNYPTSSLGNIDLACYISSGNRYVARSSTFTHYAVVVRAYMCFIINRVNSYQYYYYLGSEKDATLGNERMMTVATSANVTVSNICNRQVFPHTSYYILVQDGKYIICNRQVFPHTSYYILVQDGYIAQAASTCNSYLLADWTYTYTDNSGNTACSSSSELSICSQKDTMAFNYTACPQKIMYSDGGELYCLFSSVGSTMVYQHVYNKDNITDESTTYRISCLVVTAHGNTRYLTQYPNNCYDGQTSLSVASPGAKLAFSLITACPYTTEDNYTAAIALGILVPLALIIVIVIIVRMAYKHYQENKEVPTPKPDPKYANGEIRNKRLCKTNGVRIDEKAIIHDTPRSVEINIDEKLIRPESSTVSEDMSIGIRRESSILLDIHPSTRGTMVAESLPEMSENGDYSSEYSDSDCENDDKIAEHQGTGEFLEGTKDEGTQTPRIPQIVIDSVIGQGGHETIPDLVPPLSTAVDDQLPTEHHHEMQSEETQTEDKKTKKKKKKRLKSASSVRRIKSGTKRRPDSRIKGILKQKPKKKQVEPLITDQDSPIDPSLNDLDRDRPGSSKSASSRNPKLTDDSESNGNHVEEGNEQNEVVDGDDGQKIIPDETKDLNTSKTNLKRNESRLREKIYRVTNRDISASKRRKKQPKLGHPLEKKRGQSPDPVPESWFRHKGSAASQSRNTFADNNDDDDTNGEVSPEVDEHGNLLPPSDNCDLKRPPTQQKPFMNPKQESTEEVFEKIKSMWHFGNKWLGNTYISQTPRQ